VSRIGFYFMFLSCSNFNPVTESSSSKLELFAVLQECIYLINLYGAIILLCVKVFY